MVSNAGQVLHGNRLGVFLHSGFHFSNALFDLLNLLPDVPNLPCEVRLAVIPLPHSAFDCSLLQRANVRAAIKGVILPVEQVDGLHVLMLALDALQLLPQGGQSFRVAAIDGGIVPIVPNIIQQLRSLIVVGEVGSPSIVLAFLLLHREVGASGNQDTGAPCTNLVVAVDVKGQRPLVLVEHPIHPVPLGGGLALGLHFLSNAPRLIHLTLILGGCRAGHIIPVRAHLVRSPGHIFVDFIAHCLRPPFTCGKNSLPMSFCGMSISSQIAAI